MVQAAWRSITKFFTGTVERPSPSDIFDRAQVLVEGGFYVDDTGRTRIKRDRLFLPFKEDPEAWFCEVPGTGSEDPLMDFGTYNVYIRGVTPVDQQAMVEWLAKEQAAGAANLMVYRSPWTYAIHRNVAVSQDSKGRRWYFKGDNNASRDPGYARDNEIQWLLGAVIY